MSVAPALAAKPGCRSAPGLADIDQYCEQIPGAGGSHSPGKRGSGPAIPAATRKALPGPAGLAVVGLAGSGTKTARGGAVLHDTPPVNPFNAFDGPSVGALFVWTLIALAAALGTTAVIKRRRAAALPDVPEP